MEHESDGDTNCNWRARYGHQTIGTGTVGLGNKIVSGDHPNYSIDQNTKKPPEDSRRLADTQFPAETHTLMLV